MVSVFAEDNYVCCKASKEEAGKVLKLLGKFEKISKSKVKLHKSKLFFSTNMVGYNREKISESLQIPETNDNSKYLALLNFLERNKAIILDFLRESVRNCIGGRNGTILSRRERRF